MNVKTLEILCADHQIVLCETLYGRISLIWKGENVLLYKDYSVELDVRDITALRYVSQNEERKPQFSKCIRGTKIVCWVESVDYDGYTVLRVGEDAISIVYLPVLEESAYVEIETTAVEAYPIEY